ncbi:MAG: hypothetical protein HN404_23825 [Gemmatimonadetes bacterium]|nr:hypothetical protein [Gemmatimonadota bacterium]
MESSPMDSPPDPAAKRPSTSKNSVEPSSVAATVDVDLSAEEIRSKTATVWPKGRTQIQIVDLNAGSYIFDDLYVKFSVPSAAVDAEVPVTVTVHGNRLSDLIIAFKPGGLVFSRDAELQVTVGPDLVDVDTQSLQVWHEYSDGTVEQTTLLAEKSFKNGYFRFVAAIPGFSRYGLRR